MTGRVVVVGLGPAGPELITAGAQQRIDRIEHRYLRTARHRAAAVLPHAASFDHHYRTGASFDDVYRRIVEDLVVAAQTHGEVLYAVPGSPGVAERTVVLLAEQADTGRIELLVEPALSFADLAWVRLGVDPLTAGVRLIDGHRFAVDAAGERGPLLVSQCHNRAVLSDIKLAVDPAPSTPVTVLQRLGLPDEAIFEVAWEDLDRTFEPDHLTSLWVPELAAPVASELVAFVELVTTLRRECPWDREQTHASLRRHLLEETYEVLEAIDGLDGLDVVDDGAGDAAYSHLEEELGDLLFQVAFHARLATEAGRFTLADVARGVHDKLVRRHPHVFAGADYDVATAGPAWEAAKAAEKGRSSVMDGIPGALPALLYASKVVKKAAAVGVEVAPGGAHGDGVGVALLALVAAANAAGVDAESALRTAASRIVADVRHAEQSPSPNPAVPKTSGD